ncbi:MAG: HAMP domain-containing histidine kinase [bacterium]|nr:HAMP domain-containing histidine kinase [bacterium]
MSLRVRIAIISAGAVAIAIAIATLITFNATKSELLTEVDASLIEIVEGFDEVDDLRDLFTAFVSGERPDRNPFGRGARGFDAVYFQFLPREATTAIAFPVALPVGPAEQSVYDGSAALALRTVRVGDDNLRMLTTTISTGTVQVARSLAEVDNTLQGLGSVLRLAAVVGALLAGMVGYVVAKGAARPIGQLAAAAEHVAETQELVARIDVQRNDEVGRLAHSFNAMLAALEDSRAQQHRLVHDAGHELRTPLTAIRTNVELLGKMDDLPADERQQMITDIDFEIQELTTLVGELVELAGEPPTGVTVVGELDLGDLADRVAEKYRRRTGRGINVSAESAAVVVGDEPQLERAISNLIDNADKWSPEGAAIDVVVAGGRVSVVDQGPGIDAVDRPYVFDRFYRATKDRSTPGSGLGLSIVAKAAESHGGIAFVEDSPSGAVVGFEVPVVPQSDT